MLLRAFVRVFLWTPLIVVVAMVGIYLALDLGVVDWAFEIGAADWQEDVKAALRFKFGVHGGAIDRGAKIVGLAFTIVLGLLAFLRWWIDSQKALPERLQRYVDRIKDEHRKDRAVAIGAYASRNLKGEFDSHAEAGALRTLLGWLSPTR